MLVHQAFYGEEAGSHALLASSAKANDGDVPESGPSAALFTQLVAHTDLPFRAPSSANWAPYLSGFAFEDCYILSKTFSDPKATRSGMVFTHLLAASLDEVSHLTDLELLLNRFVPSPDKNRLTLAPFEIALNPKGSSAASNQASSHRLPSRWPQSFQTLVTALLSASQEQNSQPVVWLGQDGFAKALAALWCNSWPQIRANLSFRLCFEPQDVEDGQWTMVTIPQNCEARWRGFTIVASAETPDLDARVPVETDSLDNLSGSQALLLGLAQAEPMRDLLRDLESWPSRLADLSKVEQCCAYLSRPNLASDEARALVRNLGWLAPNPAKGVATKQRALESLIEQLASDTAENIAALRNIELAPFAQGETLLGQAVHQWTRRNLLSGASPLNVEEANALLLVKALGSSDRWWSNTIQDAVKEVLSLPQNWSRDLASNVWAWWQAQTDLVTLLSPLVPAQNEVEQALTNRCPAKLNSTTADALKAWARSRRWLVLHAALLASLIQTDAIAPRRDAIQNAFREQLEIDLAPDYLEGLRLLAHHLGGLAYLQAALQIGESRMLQIAGEMCALQSELLANLDVRNVLWRQVWAWSVHEHRHLWQGVSDPETVAQDLLTVFAEGSSIAPEILQLLAQEPQSDLTLHPVRSHLWSPLQTADPTIARAFLESTAEGWLHRLRATVSGKAVEPTYDASNTQLETPLLKVVTEETRLETHLLRRGPDQSAFGVELLCIFASVSQALALSWMEALLADSNRITAARAKQFGALVARRGWSDVANHMVKSLWRQHGEDWLSALRECTSLLSTLDKFTVKTRLYLSPSSGLTSYPTFNPPKSADLSGVSEDEWWNALHAICVDLYPTGPEDRKLWSQADGDVSALELHGGGSQQWQVALRLLRRGGGGKKITLSKLLRRMQSDFPRRNELKIFAQTLPAGSE